MSEIDCKNCVAACCQGGTIELTLDEVSVMLRGGNKLKTIAQPEDYYREKVFCPGIILDDEEVPGNKKIYGSEQPLEAGVGRYVMAGSCTFLETDEDGWQKCGIYDTRPATCQRFEVGGTQCTILRQLYGVDMVDDTTQQILDTIKVRKHSE